MAEANGGPGPGPGPKEDNPERISEPIPESNNVLERIPESILRSKVSLGWIFRSLLMMTGVASLVYLPMTILQGCAKVEKSIDKVAYEIVDKMDEFQTISIFGKRVLKFDRKQNEVSSSRDATKKGRE